MNPELEETIYCDFVTSSPTTGAATDADSTPTCEVFEDATDTTILSPTVTKRTGKTGNYRVPVACTAANGFEAGKSYNVVAAATVGAVAAKAVIQTFQMRTNGADDLAASILTRATPAQVQTELVTYGAVKTGGTIGSVTGAVGSVTNPVTAGTVSDKTGYALTATYDPAKTAAQAGAAMTLTSAYDAAKTAATQASVDAIKAVVDAIKVIDDHLATAMEVDGPVYRFTTNALEQAPTGGGGVVDNNAIAEAVLKKDWTTVTGEAAYSLLNAARMLRNAWATPGGVLTVKKEDGSSVAWTRTLAVDPAAQPIVGAT